MCFPPKTYVLLNVYLSILQQMEPTKQMKIMQEFQKQSAQMDMTVCKLLQSLAEWFLAIIDVFIFCCSREVLMNVVCAYALI
jgi:hypothetical protein